MEGEKELVDLVSSVPPSRFKVVVPLQVMLLGTEFKGEAFKEPGGWPEREVSELLRDFIREGR